MCNFISQKKYKGKVYFLQNSDLDTKKGKELLKKEYKDDIKGHGAIEHYYPELERKGINKECEDFYSPDNFPKEIASALVQGKLTRIGITLYILNDKEKAEYDKIKQQAWLKIVKNPKNRIEAWKNIK